MAIFGDIWTLVSSNNFPFEGRIIMNNFVCRIVANFDR